MLTLLPRDPQAGTIELDSKYERTLTIYGREFQKYSVEHSIYLVPVDEVALVIWLYRAHRRADRAQEEADRLEAQHHVFNIVFDSRLIFPPLPSPRYVLDLGYGAASWAIEVAEVHPNCEVEWSVQYPDDHESHAYRVGDWSRHIAAYEARRCSRKFLASSTYSAAYTSREEDMEWSYHRSCRPKFWDIGTNMYRPDNSKHLSTDKLAFRSENTCLLVRQGTEPQTALMIPKFDTDDQQRKIKGQSHEKMTIADWLKCCQAD